MSIGDILIILGCVVAGYWLVSSVMSSGIDVIDEGRKAEGRPRKAQEPDQPVRLPAPAEVPMRDWHIVLDVPADASRAEIQAAAKRRQSQAEAVGDKIAVARIQQAVAAGLAQRR